MKTFEVYESQERAKAFTYRKQLSDDVAMKTNANVCHTVFYEVKTFEVYESQERAKAFTYRKQLSDDVAMKTNANVCHEVK
ncbi:hypothetical protein BU588_12505, partial [Staphylococcus agnetis]